jgi:hypothetical protein
MVAADAWVQKIREASSVEQAAVVAGLKRMLFQSDREIVAGRRTWKVERTKMIGSYVDPAAGRITFGEQAIQWARRR